MAEESVSRRYATALFESAKDSKVVASVEADLVTIESLLTNDGDFRAFILSPGRDRTEKITLFDKVFGDRITALTCRFVKLMLEKRREEELPGIRAEFSELRRADEGTISATVTSAVELTKAEQKQIDEKLAAKLGKKVETQFEIDPSLIGGVRVAYGDFIIDGSVRGSLNRLRDTLRQDTLKQA
ncbi:MAG: ATP synthase F1 subunit delta [Armatimonadetes bacterium]|nr:ATP synthase F1 subunit delta [Armatimonadota bacterium]MBS1701864.1 ATP synthase F1 subunit delta [Armatimonadota bacterium]MBS1728299.1 ATP synthase F1 subunit delta [Armatimonadota bacterium]